MGNYFDEAWAICRMKDTVVQEFGLEHRKTIDFFFKCDTMEINRLIEYFYQLTGVEA